MALRWLALLVLLLSACAPPATPDGTLPPVIAQGNTLLAGGKTFTVRGVNYVHLYGADTSKCPQIQFGADPDCPWSIAPVQADFDRLQKLGVNTVRIFLNYYVFGGARAADPNYSLTTPLAHLDALIAAASARGIYVVPVLLQKYPQDKFAAEHYPLALDLHVRPVVQHLAANPGVLMWDLFNEPDIGSPVDERCWDWDNADFPLCYPLAVERLAFLKTLHAEVKRLDPTHLTTIGLAFAKSHTEPQQAAIKVAELVDVYSFHYYDNDPVLSGRYAAHWYYGQGFPLDLRRALSELRAVGDRPMIVSELGFPSGPGTKRTAAELRRDIDAALAVGHDERVGMLLWLFQPTPEEVAGTGLRP